ncbi:MAG: energy-coupling factor transporter ATPase [Clostridiales Family XIII bacterium]|jgi:energy-coupling factor transport system ATP-binding protein|nr:energy-coupling factor transporter ATPase [Clostridiales Family XIII bacterium]
MSITVKDLVYIYGEGTPYETLALDRVSLEIADGEFVGLIGHTGSGKSTLVQHLNGLLKPKSGRVFVGDAELWAKGAKPVEIRKKIGFLFQYPEYQLFEESVYKDIAFGPANLGLSKEETDERVRESMAVVGLDFDAFAQRSPFDLSGGQKRKAVIAGVIAMRPEVLILDEPTAGLDPRSQRDVLEMLERIKADRRVIVILISHNMDDIARMADRVIVLEKGRVALSGSPAEVFAHEEFLHSIGLGLPPVTELMRSLRLGGVDVEGSPLDVDEAEELLDRYLRESGARRGDRGKLI